MLSFVGLMHRRIHMSTLEEVNMLSKFFICLCLYCFSDCLVEVNGK